MDTEKEYSKCEICNNTFAKDHISQHIKRSHDMLPIDYYRKYLSNNSTEEICKECGKQNKFKSLNKGFSTFCCVTCSNSNKDKKEQTVKVCLEKYGVANVIPGQRH